MYMLLPEWKYCMILVVNQDAPGLKEQVSPNRYKLHFLQKSEISAPLKTAKPLRWYKNTAEIINNYVLPPFFATSGKCF